MEERGVRIYNVSCLTMASVQPQKQFIECTEHLLGEHLYNKIGMSLHKCDCIVHMYRCMLVCLFVCLFGPTTFNNINMVNFIKSAENSEDWSL